MVFLKGLLPSLLALYGSSVPLSHALSIPTPSRGYAASERAIAITETATQIANGPRALTIGGEDYPMYHGPLALPGSLTEAIQLNETKMFVAMGSHTPDVLASLATNMSQQLTSYEAYTALYDAAEQFIEWPMSTDNSDETFGEQRVTVKAFALRKATVTDLDDAELSLPDHELRKLCGRGAATLLDDGVLFVEDYHDAAQYNDPKRPDKYNANVVGFFCVDKRSGKLLPVEIRLLDTELTYTARDTPEEWALAKMALEASSSSYHQMQHMAETHAVTVPLRVEAYRTMSAEHPVRALLQRHAFMDFGLEKLAAMNLLNTSTLLDQIIGWGATGAARFLHTQTESGLSVQHKAFNTDIARRGLDTIDGHKFNAYAALYDDAIHSFVEAFVDAFYADDAAVVQDVELQNWANASATIPHVRDFPTAFDSRQQLTELLAHLVFTCSVRHHGMNGQASWHGTSAPFAPAALWKPLPQAKVKKGDKPLDVLAYTIPPKVLPAMLAIASTFHREVPESECYFSAYTSAPFSDEPKLAHAIKEFDKALRGIEETITEMERDETWPYLLLRPSQLPYYTWI